MKYLNINIANITIYIRDKIIIDKKVKFRTIIFINVINIIETITQLYNNIAEIIFVINIYCDKIMHINIRINANFDVI